LTLLYRSTHRRRRCGAPMLTLAHSASFHSREKGAPANPGIKHLARRERTDTDLAGVDEARREAVAHMAGIVKDHLQKYWQIAIRVRDDQPAPVLALMLSMEAESRS